MMHAYWEQTAIRSDEGLMLKTSAFESLYGGQFTLSTQLIKPNSAQSKCFSISRQAGYSNRQQPTTLS